MLWLYFQAILCDQVRVLIGQIGTNFYRSKFVARIKIVKPRNRKLGPRDNARAYIVLTSRMTYDVDIGTNPYKVANARTYIIRLLLFLRS